MKIETRTRLQQICDELDGLADQAEELRDELVGIYDEAQPNADLETAVMMMKSFALPDQSYVIRKNIENAIVRDKAMEGGVK